MNETIIIKSKLNITTETEEGCVLSPGMRNFIDMLVDDIVKEDINLFMANQNK